jgi:hypothetical protein
MASNPEKGFTDSKFKATFDLIKKKRGAFTVDDDDFTTVRAIFKEIPVFKDIPHVFKL